MSCKHYRFDASMPPPPLPSSTSNKSGTLKRAAGPFEGKYLAELIYTHIYF